MKIILEADKTFPINVAFSSYFWKSDLNSFISTVLGLCLEFNPSLLYIVLSLITSIMSKEFESIEHVNSNFALT